ncbi:hypothetical protein ACX03_02380 [Vibrio parahaemolyticus]|nr:hypothetical protein ACX03_02380 [Vibrio parahaemolyticus]
MFATIVKGLEPSPVLTSPYLEDEIKERYNVDSETKVPLDIKELSKRIGEKPSLLLCSMLVSEQKCSKFGTQCLIEVLAGIAGNQPIIVHELDYGPVQTRPFNFKLITHGFLNDEFEPINEGLGERNNASVSFKFTPEYRVQKSSLRDQDRLNGSYDLDLKIDMAITVFVDSPNKDISPPNTIQVGSVVVEFDGPRHLSDEQVRKDKLRDSLVQSNGSTVFRIQMPYQHVGTGSTELNLESLDTLLKGQIEDIKSHFQNRLYNTVNANYLLKSIEQNNVKFPIK